MLDAIDTLYADCTLTNEIADFEDQFESMNSHGASSPRSQEFINFETFLRTELPMLVETGLQDIVNRETAPAIERARSQLPDLIRTSISRLAQTFKSGRVLSSAENASASTPFQRSPSQIEHDRALADMSSITGTAESPSDLYRGPAHLDAEANAAAPGLFHSEGYRNTGGETSDSGYGSGPNSCNCACHAAGTQIALSFGQYSRYNLYDFNLRCFKMMRAARHANLFIAKLFWHL